MGKGPGLYTEIGKKARGMMNKQSCLFVNLLVYEPATVSFILRFNRIFFFFCVCIIMNGSLVVLAVFEFSWRIWKMSTDLYSVSIVGWVFEFVALDCIVDLLYKDYQGDQKLSITTYSSTGVVSHSCLYLSVHHHCRNKALSFMWCWLVFVIKKSETLCVLWWFFFL